MIIVPVHHFITPHNVTQLLTVLPPTRTSTGIVLENDHQCDTWCLFTFISSYLEEMINFKSNKIKGNCLSRIDMSYNSTNTSNFEISYCRLNRITNYAFFPPLCVGFVLAYAW